MKKNYELDLIIEKCIDFLSELLEIKNLTWNFVRFEKDDSTDLKENFSSLFNFDERCIYINPYIRKNLKKEFKIENEDVINCIICSKLAHEVRHAFQLEHQEEYEYTQYFEDLKKNINLMNNYIEIDACAFEQAFLWIITNDKNFIILFNNSVQDKIQENALKLYDKYIIKYNFLISNFEN